MRGGRISKRVDHIRPRRTVFLMVEGESESVYFSRIARITESFSIKVKIAKDRRPAEIVRSCYEEALKLGLEDDDIMVAVFDLDVVNDKKLDDAITLAEEKGVTIMVSNLSFEVWLLMHLTDVSRLHSQDDYEEMLSRHIGHRYRKSEGLKAHINLESISDAITRGMKRLKDPDPRICKTTHNSTTLWKLVDEVISDDHR